MKTNILLAIMSIGIVGGFFYALDMGVQLCKDLYRVYLNWRKE